MKATVAAPTSPAFPFPGGSIPSSRLNTSAPLSLAPILNKLTGANLKATLQTTSAELPLAFTRLPGGNPSLPLQQPSMSEPSLGEHCNRQDVANEKVAVEVHQVCYHTAVWEKFHILGRVQVFAVSSMCAVVIAAPLALASIPSDGTSLQPFLGPPRRFDPLISFGSFFVSVLTVFLGYYHLGRHGALWGLATSAVTCFVTYLCAFWLFGFELVGHSIAIQVLTFVGALFAVIVLIFVLHIKASNSSAIRDAQLALHLVPDTSDGLIDRSGRV
jgi:hypothetical protein